MKKTFIFAVVLLLFVLTGCSYNSGDTGGKDTDKAQTVSSVADFEYTENDENGITVTKYVGKARNVVIPEEIENKAVTQIGSRVFQYNCIIVSAEIPESVTSIGAAAFSDCLSLSSVSLPQKLALLDDCAFENCAKLSSVKLPTTLTAIGDSVFKNCASLKRINIPKSITNWGAETFLNSGIEAVDFEDGIQEVGYRAFAYTDITTVALPKSVRKIGGEAFCGCRNLASVTLNEGLTAIKEGAFALKSKLSEIVIPASVTELNELTFTRCDNLQAVRFEGDAPENYQCRGPGYYYNIDEVSYTVYYHEEATGFTSPKWHGYPTEIW